LRGFGLACRLVIAGDGPLRRWLAEACPEATFTGVVSREAVADVFASSDVCIFPSRTGTVGSVVLEAQSSGLPVVVSDRGSREHVVDGLTGVVCANGDAEPCLWAKAIASLLCDRERRVALGTAARAYAVTRAWDRAFAPLFDTYRAIDDGFTLPTFNNRVAAW
jgi:glycosyltransferase involved in cell wall biosynthesis